MEAPPRQDYPDGAQRPDRATAAAHGGPAIGRSALRVSVWAASSDGRSVRTARSVSVVLAGGGTAGHVEPAMAVADALTRSIPASASPRWAPPAAWRPGWCPTAATTSN